MSGIRRVNRGRVGTCPWVLTCFFFSCVSMFSVVLHPGDRLAGKVWKACEEFEDNEGGISLLC